MDAVMQPIKVRDYLVTKHFQGFPPEFKVLNAPVYRVSRNNILMSMDFADLDTAVECAVGFVIKNKMQSVQDKLQDTMADIYGELKLETLQTTLDGKITYPAQT